MISFDVVTGWFAGLNVSQELIVPLSVATELVLTGAIAAVAYYLVRWLLMVIVRRLVEHTPTTWDDDLLNDAALSSVCRMVPPLLFMYVLRDMSAHAGWVSWLIKINEVYLCITVIRVVCAVLRGVASHLKHDGRFDTYPVQGVYQMVKLLVIVLGSLVCLAILISRDPLAVIAGLGASAAILSLVFKDTILGFVAGIQLSANNMLHEGDWIVAPAFDADGDVVSIGLNTIKVRNWDKTVTTIPTYSLITGSFQNWERMRDFGARRVKRSVLMDVNSVRFLSADELDSLVADGYVAEDIKKESRVVNLRLFREYVERYLDGHPAVSRIDGTTTMARQLQPTSAGLPIELYFFTATTEWVRYEHIQADIFDHLYAVVGRFGLRIFQSPAGADFSRPSTLL